MKTLIIYNELTNPLKYSIVDGDYSRFNGVSINSIIEHEYINECIDFLFTHDGEFRIDFDYDVSLVENKEWDKVAIITFLYLNLI